MPFYEYSCDRCGRFEERHSISDAGKPVVCPTCQGTAQSVISAPFLATMNKFTRIAHERNEKSAHEPKVVRREPSEGGHGRHSHGKHPHHHPHRSPRRPWMIGH